MSETLLSSRNLAFELYEVLDAEALTHRPRFAEHSRETFDAALGTARSLAEKLFAPHNRKGDEHEPLYENGSATLIPEVKPAVDAFLDAGFLNATRSFEQGGMQLPTLLSQACFAHFQAANVGSSAYPFLTMGAANLIESFGSEEQKQRFLQPMIEGRFFGTMALTEPHAGSSLSDIRTRAEPAADGSYRIKGNKIFISGGDHPLSENIVHMVLAKLPDAPPGVKGISLFIVPKFLPDAEGNVGARNAVSCGSIEHKMGIKASATCVMNFDGATGYLIGEPNKGLHCMFTMMNHARLGTGMQGLCLGETSYQGAVRYARERLQMRSLTGPKAPDKPADPIIVHPDVRRMLLTQKTLVEGCRMLAACCARQLDLEHGHPDADGRRAATRRAALLIPIVKAFLTDVGQEVASLGVQVYGGHGFIREWGMEQLMRDSRITQIYEGTNGIQALDLVRRKLLGDQGGELLALQGELAVASEALQGRAVLAPLAEPVLQRLEEWRQLTGQVLEACARDPQEIGATSVDFLQYSAYVLLAALWLQAAARAQEALDGGSGEGDFYRAKLRSADFYLRRILPRASMHREALLGGADCLMALPEEHFSF